MMRMKEDPAGRAGTFGRYIRYPRSQFSKNLRQAPLSYRWKGGFAMFKYALMAGAVALLAGCAAPGYDYGYGQPGYEDYGYAPGYGAAPVYGGVNVGIWGGGGDYYRDRDYDRRGWNDRGHGGGWWGRPGGGRGGDSGGWHGGGGHGGDSNGWHGGGGRGGNSGGWAGGGGRGGNSGGWAGGGGRGGGGHGGGSGGSRGGGGRGDGAEIRESRH
jgi:hypothetical protein